MASGRSATLHPPGGYRARHCILRFGNPQGVARPCDPAPASPARTACRRCPQPVPHGHRLGQRPGARLRQVKAGDGAAATAGCPATRSWDYLRKARPRVDEERVFLRVHAPYRPLSRLEPNIGRRTPCTRPRGCGDNREPGRTPDSPFRGHRGSCGPGATPEVVGSLLRHRSPESTALYAKVDANMLRQVAQPWIGGVPCR